MVALAPDPYAGLAPADALWLRQQTAALEKLYRRSVEDMLTMGRILAVVRGRLRDERRYHAYCEAELPFTRKTADNMIHAAEQFGGKEETVSLFSPSALYLLAAPSTPPEARTAAIGYAEGGERITKGAALKLIKAARMGELAPEQEPGPDPVKALPPSAQDEADRRAGAAVRVLLAGGGDAVARLDISTRDDPEGDRITTATYSPPDDGRPLARETGRDLAGVLEALVAADAGYKPAPPLVVDPGRFRAWARGIARGVRADYKFLAGSQEEKELEGVADLELTKCCGKYRPELGVPFERWACDYLRGECRRAAEQIKNGGLFRTSRDPDRPRQVGRYEEGDKDEG